MSFEGAINDVNKLLEKLSGVRKEALQKLPVVKSAAFNILFDLVSKALKILNTANEIEKRVELGRGLKRVCGNWILMKEGDRLSIKKLKPLRILTYTQNEGRVSITDGEVSLELSQSSIKLGLRGRDIVISDISLEGISEYTDIIKSLGRYLFELTDTIADTLNRCLKSLGML